MTAEMRWLRSPKVGVVSLSVRKQMSYSASLSSTMHSSAFSTSWCTDSVALYGSTTVSDTCTHARTCSHHSSMLAFAISASWCTDSVALYGSTTVSDTGASNVRASAAAHAHQGD